MWSVIRDITYIVEVVELDNQDGTISNSKFLWRKEKGLSRSIRVKFSLRIVKRALQSILQLIIAIILVGPEIPVDVSALMTDVTEILPRYIALAKLGDDFY